MASPGVALIENSDKLTPTQKVYARQAVTQTKLNYSEIARDCSVMPSTVQRVLRHEQVQDIIRQGRLLESDKARGSLAVATRTLHKIVARLDKQIDSADYNGPELVLLAEKLSATVPRLQAIAESAPPEQQDDTQTADYLQQVIEIGRAHV